MVHLPASKVRQSFSDILNRVAYRGERIVLRRRGKDLAAVVPLQDLKFLDELEDRVDLEAARRALKEKGSLSWETLKKRLKL